jgi:hypothetical protein
MVAVIHLALGFMWPVVGQKLPQYNTANKVGATASCPMCIWYYGNLDLMKVKVYSFVK